MKVALIPPMGLEDYAGYSPFHLVLCQELKRPEYLNTYLNARKLDNYIVLDNGAAEGETVGTTYLLDMAYSLRAQEMVLPDVIGSHVATLRAVARFFAEHGDYWTNIGRPRPKYMAVAQGSRLENLQTCINEYARMPDIEVLGLPRHIIAMLGKNTARLDLANWVEWNYPGRFEIHLLGTDPGIPAEVHNACTYAPHVRSLDSSMAFNYAIGGARLELASITIGFKRPEGYFTKDWSDIVDEKVVRANVECFIRWGEGRA